MAAEADAPRRPAGLTPASWTAREAGWGILCGLLLALFVPVIVVAPFDPKINTIGGTLAAQVVLTLMLVGTALYVARVKPLDLSGRIDVRRTLNALGWRRFRPTDLFRMLGALFSYYGCAIVYSAVFGVPHQDDIADQLGLDRGPALAATAVFLICVVAPMAEETFFRGMAFAGLRGRFSRVPAAMMSGAIFGAVHAPSGPSAVVPLAVFGTFLALLFERTDSIVPGVLAHMINNSIAIAVAA